MDPEKLNSIYSKVICSSAITRQNLSRKLLTSPPIDKKNDEDDTQFFENLKKKINFGSLKCLQNKNKLTQSYARRKRKHNFIDETTNIMKRFNETIEQKTSIEIDTIKLHSQAKKVCEDNVRSCINYNNGTFESVNTIAGDEFNTAPRDFTIVFQSEEKSANKENIESKCVNLNNINDIEDNSIK